MSRNTKSKTFNLFLIFCLLQAYALPIGLPAAAAQSLQKDVAGLPAPGAMLPLSPNYTPAIIEGITIYPDNPLQFDFIIDAGDDQLQGEALTKEAQKLISYFMATLTIPEDEMWVNLSPSGWVKQKI